MSQDKKRNWTNLLFILAIIIVFSIYSMVHARQGVSYQLTGSAFALTGPEGFMAEINLNNVKSLEFRSEYTRGTCVTGNTNGGYSYGIWENEEFGEYQLCVLDKVPACVVITENNGTVTVFNFENTRTTMDFGNTLDKYMRENSYGQLRNG